MLKFPLLKKGIESVLGKNNPITNNDGYVNYKLLNQKGWYCMKLDVTVGIDNIAKTKITKACSAKVAENKVTIPVASTGQSSSRVGVHLRSDIKVETVPEKCN